MNITSMNIASGTSVDRLEFENPEQTSEGLDFLPLLVALQQQKMTSSPEQERRLQKETIPAISEGEILARPVMAPHIRAENAGVETKSLEEDTCDDMMAVPSVQNTNNLPTVASSVPPFVKPDELGGELPIIIGSETRTHEYGLTDSLQAKRDIIHDSLSRGTADPLTLNSFTGKEYATDIIVEPENKLMNGKTLLPYTEKIPGHENITPQVHYNNPVSQIDVITRGQVAEAESGTLSQNKIHVLVQSAGTPEWERALGHQLACFTKDGVHHAELRLHPEELGAIQISMRMSHERLHIHFVADNPLAREALESALPQLKHSLAESGINLGQSSVGSDSQSSQHELNNGEVDGGEDVSLESAEVLLSDVPERPAYLHYRSGINTFA